MTDLHSQLTDLNSAKTVFVTNFRQRHKECHTCLQQNDGSVPMSRCLTSCAFYKNKTKKSLTSEREITKLVEYFYKNHPIPDLTPNPRRSDTTTIRGVLQHLSKSQLKVVFDFMYYKQIPNLSDIGYYSNQALMVNHLREKRAEQGSCSWLVKYFYSLFNPELKSPNFVKECVNLDQNLQHMSWENIREVLEYMHKQGESSLSLFNYYRNKYQASNGTFSSSEEIVDEFDLLVGGEQDGIL